MKKIIGITLIIVLSAFVKVSLGQDGTTPYLNSTHTYTVQMFDGASNTATWEVWDAATQTILATQPTITPSINGNEATAEITWSGAGILVAAPVGTPNYWVVFKEETATSCISVRNLEVEVTGNSFYVSSVATPTECNDFSDQILPQDDLNRTTTIDFTVDLNKDGGWDIDTWEYDFTLTLSAPVNYTLETVSVDGGADLGTSGTYTGISVLGTNGTSVITVEISGDVNNPQDVVLALSNGKAIKGTTTVADNGTGNKTGTFTVDALPNTSEITAD